MQHALQLYCAAVVAPHIQFLAVHWKLNVAFNSPATMQFLKVIGSVLQQSQRAARSLERSVQEVVEVLQPGPLGATAARWDAQRRAEADQAVQQALDNWQALQQQQRQQQQEQWLDGMEQHAKQWNADGQQDRELERGWQQQQQQREPHANS